MALAYENDPTFRPGALTQLFEVTPYALGGNRRMAVDPDGERFLLLKIVGETNTEDATPLQINVILNWFQELTERVPTD